MPDFEGTGIVELQPLDQKVPVQFKVTVCTGASTNDGYLPYGYSVATASVTATKMPVNRSATSALIPSSASSLSVTSNIITVFMDYPVSSSSGVSTLGPGTYHLTFQLNLNTGSCVREANFNRVFARDK